MHTDFRAINKAKQVMKKVNNPKIKRVALQTFWSTNDVTAGTNTNETISNLSLDLDLILTKIYN